jgi:hypothetical protein
MPAKIRLAGWMPGQMDALGIWRMAAVLPWNMKMSGGLVHFELVVHVEGETRILRKEALVKTCMALLMSLGMPVTGTLLMDVTNPCTMSMD